MADEDETLARVERHLAASERPLAAAALLPMLERRAAAGDRAAAAAVVLLSGAEGVPPDTLAAMVDRLLALVAQQEKQIQTLMELLEARL